MNRDELNKLFDEHFIDECDGVYDAQNEIVEYAEKAVKLHISDVRRSFSFTYDDLKQAFMDGSHVTTWSDMGIQMKYDNFEKWFDEWFKKNYTSTINT